MQGDKGLGQQFSIGVAHPGECEKGLLGVRTSLIIQKLYIKWCKGCKTDFYFWTGCGLQNELRTAGLGFTV